MPCPQRFVGLFIVLLLNPMTLSAGAKEVKTLQLKATTPELNLPGVDGKTYRLDDFADARVLVVVFRTFANRK
jgi:hypothetical protein